MAETSGSASNPQTNPLPGSPSMLLKVDTIDTATEAVTRVNTSEKNKSSTGEKDEPEKGDKAVVMAKKAQPEIDESLLLTGKKLILAHIGFLL